MIDRIWTGNWSARTTSSVQAHITARLKSKKVEDPS
jgi:hypothetical protein